MRRKANPHGPNISICVNERCSTNWRMPGGKIHHREIVAKAPYRPCPGCGANTQPLEGE